MSNYIGVGFFRDLRPVNNSVLPEVYLSVWFQKELGLEVAKGSHGDNQLHLRLDCGERWTETLFSVPGRIFL